MQKNREYFKKKKLYKTVQKVWRFKKPRWYTVHDTGILVMKTFSKQINQVKPENDWKTKNRRLHDQIIKHAERKTTREEKYIDSLRYIQNLLGKQSSISDF